MGCGKEDRRWKDGVDKPESGVTVALVRGVSTCHSPIIQYWDYKAKHGSKPHYSSCLSVYSVSSIFLYVHNCTLNF